MLVERNDAMDRSHREHGPSGPHVPAPAAWRSSGRELDAASLRPVGGRLAGANAHGARVTTRARTGAHLDSAGRGGARGCLRGGPDADVATAGDARPAGQRHGTTAARLVRVASSEVQVSAGHTAGARLEAGAASFRAGPAGTCRYCHLSRVGMIGEDGQ